MASNARPSRSGGSRIPLTTAPFYPMFAADQIEKTPSIRMGMEPKEERKNRVKGIKFLLTIGQQLKLPFAAQHAAAVYFHKFYFRQSFQQHDKYEVAAACIYLASKAEECRKRIREVMETWYFFQRAKGNRKQKAPDPKTHPKEYQELIDRILNKEMILLQTIEFMFQCKHPHTFLVYIFKYFARHQNFDEKAVQELCRTCWYFIYDSFRIYLCIIYPPQWIALAATEMTFRHEAAKARKEGRDTVVPIPEWNWYKIFDNSLPNSEVDKIIVSIAEVMDSDMQNWADHLKGSRRPRS